MINKTVATKLTDDEHSKLIAECTRLGVTPSALIRDSIMEKIESKKIISEDMPKKEEYTIEEMNKMFAYLHSAVSKAVDEKMKYSMRNIR